MGETRKYGIIQAELQTGILLREDGRYSLDGTAHVIPAESLEEARQIAKNLVLQRPHVECSIRDERGMHVEFVRSDSLQYGRKDVGSHFESGEEKSSSISA